MEDKLHQYMSSPILSSKEYNSNHQSEEWHKEKAFLSNLQKL